VNGALAAHAATLVGQGPVVHTLTLWLQQYLPHIAAHFLSIDIQEAKVSCTNPRKNPEKTQKIKTKILTPFKNRTTLRNPQPKKENLQKSEI
jgi:hypothetical protein